MLPKCTKQILAIRNKIRKGVKNPGPAKGKIRDIEKKVNIQKWLAQ